jgi:hypothetical protein
LVDHDNIGDTLSSHYTPTKRVFAAGCVLDSYLVVMGGLCEVTGEVYEPLLPSMHNFIEVFSLTDSMWIDVTHVVWSGDAPKGYVFGENVHAIGSYSMLVMVESEVSTDSCSVDNSNNYVRIGDVFNPLYVLDIVCANGSWISGHWTRCQFNWLYDWSCLPQPRVLCSSGMDYQEGLLYVFGGVSNEEGDATHILQTLMRTMESRGLDCHTQDITTSVRRRIRRRNMEVTSRAPLRKVGKSHRQGGVCDSAGSAAHCFVVDVSLLLENRMI